MFPSGYAAFSKSPKHEQTVLQAVQKKTNPNAGDEEYPGRLAKTHWKGRQNIKG